MKFGRAILQDVEGYVPGEQPSEAGIVKLNTNENPYPPSPKALEAIRDLPPEAMGRYPDALSIELRSACAERFGFEGPDWAIVGNGMDELLAMAIRAFVEPGEPVVSVYPTYTLYETLARLHGAVYTSVELDDEFQIPAALYETSARLCFLPRPNAPTGVCSPRADVERLCEGFDGLVVIDEAYADFAGDNCLDFPRRYENAVVMRTFSKSYSLAGMRVGAAFARPEIIRELLRTKDSYNLNALSQAAALAAIDDPEHMESNVARIKKTRARMTEALRALGFSVPDSQANFMLAQWTGDPNTRTIFERLREKGVLVRYFSAPRLESSLRISVGTDDETDALLRVLEEIVQS